MKEVARNAKLFEEAVANYSETIACRNQNLPIGQFYWPDDEKWDSPSLEKYKSGMKKLKMLSGYESKFCLTVTVIMVQSLYRLVYLQFLYWALALVFS